ncbi:hypothetical protein [Flavobacterium sp. 3HN19-14]|uniref:hypothetical protein n=1 Tax=Flavobacterium sp. 3HN19-14 TaxID=3448133 RepID=UPI003EE09362
MPQLRKALAVSRYTMKTLRIFIYLTIFSFASCKTKKGDISTFDQRKEEFLQTIQAKDSGYIIKQKGIEFLLATNLIDTLNSNWNQAKEGDTIGKFYKNKLTNSYFLCTIDLSKKYSFETHLLVEIKPNGKILKKKDFSTVITRAVGKIIMKVLICMENISD